MQNICYVDLVKRKRRKNHENSKSQTSTSSAVFSGRDPKRRRGSSPNRKRTALILDRVQPPPRKRKAESQTHRESPKRGRREESANETNEDDDSISLFGSQTPSPVATGRRRSTRNAVSHRPVSPTASEITQRATECNTNPFSHQEIDEYPVDEGDEFLEALLEDPVEEADLPDYLDEDVPGIGNHTSDNDEVSASEDRTSDSDEDEELPVRLCTGFNIKNAVTGEPVDPFALTDEAFESGHFTASGLAAPWEEPDNETEEEKELFPETPAGMVHVNLTRILERDVHWYDSEKGFDKKLYIRTEYAWYILGRPSRDYQNLFDPLLIRQQLCHHALSQLLINNQLTLEQFLDSIDQLPISVPLDALHIARVRRALDADEELKHLRRAPIVANLKPEQVSASKPKKKSKKPKAKVAKPLEMLKHTIVTPTVQRFVEDLYDMTMEVVGGADVRKEDEAVVKELESCKEHHDDPEKVKWGKEIVKGKGTYSSAFLDGEKYKRGNVVMVAKDLTEFDEWAVNEETTTSGTPESDSILDETGNFYGNHVWFCKIEYFYDEINPRGEKTKMFHGHWLQHGSRTLLQETAHSHSLYMYPGCDNNPVASILRKANTQFLAPDVNEEPDDKAHKGTDFFCALMWNADQCSFTDIPSPREQERLLEALPVHKPCLWCAIKEERDSDAEILVTADYISQYGVTHHVHDFVYVTASNTKLLRIAQITRIKVVQGEPRVSVRFLERRDDLIKPGDGMPAQEKRLVYTQKKYSILFGSVDSKCYVRHISTDSERDIEEWVQEPDHWYTNERLDTEFNLIHGTEEDSLERCEECLSNHMDQLRLTQAKLEQQGKLRGLELFAGGGGMGTGMNCSGFVETKWAVEFMAAAARTYAENHPDTTVYCQDSNALLKYAIETRQGKRPKALTSRYQSKEACPPLPKPGEVDFILGGPPCQAFSGANHVPRVNDQRATLPANMLSYVEEYHPDYFLLENVTGLLRYPLKAVQDGPHRLSGGIKSGMVKMIVRVLIALGYQVHFKILQAGQYGAPQSRERIIFLASKRGIKLPNFPIPTHDFERAREYKVPCNKSRTLPPATRARDPTIRNRETEAKYSYAPLKRVTVLDAISDLPRFDWINPHHVVPATSKSKEEDKARLEAGYELFDAFNHGRTNLKWATLPGFPDGGEYVFPPTTSFQKWMRQDIPEDAAVEGHVTPRYRASIVEATVTVPFSDKADHRNLPVRLRPVCARPGAKQEKHSFYGRISGDSYFNTALTDVNPANKGIRSLHPTQKRIITVREAARSQGFPDHYDFRLESEGASNQIRDMYKIIGNAVPVPLAVALGKSIGEALHIYRQSREEEQREGSVEY